MGSIMAAADNPKRQAWTPSTTSCRRFDPRDIDVPGGRARIRLDGGEAGTVDALIEGGIARLVPAEGDPDACFEADPPSGRRSPRDVRAGMAAYRAVAFGSARTSTWASASLLRPAATPTPSAFASSASAPPTTTSRSSARARARRCSASTAWAAPSPRSCRRSRPSRRRGSGSSAVDLPGFGDSHKPALGQLRRALVRARRDRAPRRARDRARAPGRQQHGRADRDRDRASAPRPGRENGAPLPRARVAPGPRLEMASAHAAAPARLHPADARARWSSRSSGGSSPARTTAGRPRASTSSCART